MQESREILTIRQICWQRAKGELQAILYTFWGDGSIWVDDSFDKVSQKIKSFIEDIEQNTIIG